MHDYLCLKLNELDLFINSNDKCIPHIVNISLNSGIKPETMLHALEEDEIYISTQTACSTGDYSKAVYAVTLDEEKAKRSMRISISHLTKKEDIDKLVESLEKNIKRLNLRS